MSHNIQTNDKVVSILGTEWHKLAVHRPDLFETGIPFEESSLNWEVTSKDVFYDPDKPAIAGWKAIMREDKGLVLNVVKKSYEIIQNQRIFEALEKALVGVKHKITCTGSLGNCCKVFVCVELTDNQDYLVNKEKFQNYLCFISSHNSSFAFEAYDTSTRICCQNTLNWSRSQKGILNLRVFHTKNSEVKITRMEEEIERLLVKREEFYKTYEGLCARPISNADAEKLLAGWIAPENAEELSTKSYNQVTEMMNLFSNGVGNNGKTASSLLNGVTEYYTHHYTDNANKRFLSNMGGAADNNKLDFWETINGSWTDIIKRGEKLLATV